jgi:hypothetical protein
MKRNSTLCVATMAAALGLAACSGDDLTRNFGMTRDAPDEFTVTTRAPLSMPPDFSLRPPQPGASRPQEQSTSDSAQATLTGGDSLAAPAPTPGTTPGEAALLAAAGPPPPGDIRAKVDADAVKGGDRTLTETLLFWQTPPKPGTVVDPTQEAARLHENAALGKPPDDGETPVIKPKTTSWFDRIF